MAVNPQWLIASTSTYNTNRVGADEIDGYELPLVDSV